MDKKIIWEKWNNRFPAGRPVLCGRVSEDDVKKYLASYREHAVLLQRDLKADHVLYAVFVPGIFKKYRFYLQPMNHTDFLQGKNKHPEYTLFSIDAKEYSY